MTVKHSIKLKANFERNLEEIEVFLLLAEAGHAFDALLGELNAPFVPLPCFHFNGTNTTGSAVLG